MQKNQVFGIAYYDVRLIMISVQFTLYVNREPGK